MNELINKVDERDFVSDVYDACISFWFRRWIFRFDKRNGLGFDTKMNMFSLIFFVNENLFMAWKLFSGKVANMVDSDQNVEELKKR